MKEVKAIHDQAAMLQAAARVAHNVEAETRAREIRERASRRAGELSKKIEKAAGPGRGHKESADSGSFSSKGRVLSGAGITTQQASEWERLADVPEHRIDL